MVCRFPAVSLCCLGGLAGWNRVGLPGTGVLVPVYRIVSVGCPGVAMVAGCPVAIGSRVMVVTSCGTCVAGDAGVVSDIMLFVAGSNVAAQMSPSGSISWTRSPSAS